MTGTKGSLQEFLARLETVDEYEFLRERGGLGPEQKSQLEELEAEVRQRTEVALASVERTNAEVRALIAHLRRGRRMRIADGSETET